MLPDLDAGLGEIRNGKGIYGLQRAFRTAGAKAVLIEFVEGR